MERVVSAIAAVAALCAVCLVAGCNKAPEPVAPAPGQPVTGAATQPGVPKQGGANAAAEAPVAAPSGAGTGNYAGGLK